MRLPRHFHADAGKGDFDPFGYEILQEKAATLARLGRRLEEALQALAAYDAAHPEASAPGEEAGAHRQKLVAAAGEALWYYVVQREVSGLRDTEAVLRELRVPREVRLRMGYFPSGAER